MSGAWRQEEACLKFRLREVNVKAPTWFRCNTVQRLAIIAIIADGRGVGVADQTRFPDPGCSSTDPRPSHLVTSRGSFCPQGTAIATALMTLTWESSWYLPHRMWTLSPKLHSAKFPSLSPPHSHSHSVCVWAHIAPLKSPLDFCPGLLHTFPWPKGFSVKITDFTTSPEAWGSSHTSRSWSWVSVDPTHLPRFHMQTWLFLPPSAARTGCRPWCEPSFAVIYVYILNHQTKVGSCSRDQNQKTIDFWEREGKNLGINGKNLFQMATINLPWNNHGWGEESKTELTHLGKWKAAENIASTSEKFRSEVISEQEDLKSDQETKIQVWIKEQLTDYRQKVSKYFSEANRRTFRSKPNKCYSTFTAKGPGWICGQGTSILWTKWCGQNK